MSSCQSSSRSCPPCRAVMVPLSKGVLYLFAGDLDLFNYSFAGGVATEFDLRVVDRLVDWRHLAFQSDDLSAFDHLVFLKASGHRDGFENDDVIASLNDMLHVVQAGWQHNV